MAKYVRTFTGDFDEALSFCEDTIQSRSMSASYEDGNTFSAGSVKIAVRVYERYSAIGSNRVSLSFTLVGDGERLSLTAITSGGSQAMFLKINTWGEHSFLDTLRDAVEQRYPD